MSDGGIWNILTPYGGAAQPPSPPAAANPFSPVTLQYVPPVSGSPYGQIVPVQPANPGPPGATAIAGSLAPFQGYPAPPPSPDALLVRQAALRALGLVNPGQDENANVQPYTDNFAKVADPSAVNMKNWTPEKSVHANYSAEAAVPGYPSYVVKAYDDPDLGNTIAVTHPTWSPQHILGLIPYGLGQPVNAWTAQDFLNASASTNAKSGK